MYYVNHRWLGGLLTNHTTIQKSIQRLKELEEMSKDGRYELLTKKEVQRLERERQHLEQNLAGIKEMPALPDMLFVVDSNKEEIAVKEARKLGIPVVAIVDTNCDPDLVDYVIPGNDDALRSIRLFTSRIADAVMEGRQAAVEKQLELDKIRAEEAAEQLERERQAAAMSGEEALEADLEAREEAARAGELEFENPQEGLSPVVADAEEVADGRVRSPRGRRKPVSGRPHARKAEDSDEVTAEEPS
jgi:small subunit ribosomal protein S2